MSVRSRSKLRTELLLRLLNPEPVLQLDGGLGISRRIRVGLRFRDFGFLLWVWSRVLKDRSRVASFTLRRLVVLVAHGYVKPGCQLTNHNSHSFTLNPEGNAGRAHRAGISGKRQAKGCQGRVLQFRPLRTPGPSLHLDRNGSLREIRDPDIEDPQGSLQTPKEQVSEDL